MEMTLDTISRQLKTDCCWIQLVNPGTAKLPMVASLGFSPDMYREMNLLDKEHLFSHEIVGLGHNIVISSLSRDGKYDIPIFRNSGFKSLLAVPIMTYRVHGILGIGYRTRFKFNEEFTHLVNVIANLLGMSLHKTNLSKQLKQKDSKDIIVSTPVESVSQAAEAETIPDESDREPESKPAIAEKKKAPPKTFGDHDRKMKLFNESHE